MSKRMIVVEIDPHEDGVRCGTCKYRRYVPGTGTTCDVHGGQLYFRDPHIAGMDTPKRHPACVNMELRYTRMVEALRETKELIENPPDAVEEWMWLADRIGKILQEDGL